MTNLSISLAHLPASMEMEAPHPAVPEYTVAKLAELTTRALPTLVLLSVCHALVVVLMRRTSGDKKMAQQVACEIDVITLQHNHSYEMTP